MLRDGALPGSQSAVDNSSVAALAVAAALDGDRRTAASSLAALCGERPREPARGPAAGW
jgi:hypothetical protein